MAHEELVRNIDSARDSYLECKARGDELTRQACLEYQQANEHLRLQAYEAAKLFVVIMSPFMSISETERSLAYFVHLFVEKPLPSKDDIDLLSATIELAKATKQELLEADLAARGHEFPRLRTVFHSLWVDEPVADDYAMAVMRLYRSVGCHKP